MRVVSISGYSTFNFSFISIYTRENSIPGNPIDFTPEVENEGIEDAVSHILYRPLFNTSNKFGGTQHKLKI